MGVQGLLSHCLAHRSECVEQVDLIEEARVRGGIEILVDFYSFEHYLMRNLWKTLSVVSGNPYLRILGGEYGYIDAYITKLVKDLQSMDVHLVMFVDGAKGSSKIVTEQKLETWKFRHRNDLKKFQDILDVCCDRKRIEDIPDTTSVRPVLLEVQVLETLKECKCEVVQCSTGEADYVLARNLQYRPKAYAVLSNDSDFCVFRNCKFIPNDLFDLESDLQLGKSQPFPEKPIRLLAGVISANKVVASLELSSPEGLVEMSIVCGNDFTSSYMRHLKHKLGLGGKIPLTEVAAWVSQYGTVERHPEITRELRHNAKLQEAILRSRQFYSLELPEDRDFFKGVISDYIDDAIKEGTFPANVMSMHLQFYWHRMLLEDNSYDHPCVEMALSGLRGYVYRMVLDRRDRMVAEYGRSPWEELKTTTVYAVNDRQVRTVDFIQPDKIFWNLKTFAHIMIHLEPDFDVKFFDRYGRKNGFTSYVLRYFLRLNTGANLYISLEEFMVILATAFATVEEPWYQTLPIVPPIRAITIANWFQDIYRHAYLFLGKLLHLTHEFPKPKEIFCGAVFTAFFMAHLQEGVMPAPVQRRVRAEMDKVIYERRHMTRHLVQGIFHYSDRF